MGSWLGDGEDEGDGTPCGCMDAMPGGNRTDGVRGAPVMYAGVGVPIPGEAAGDGQPDAEPTVAASALLSSNSAGSGRSPDGAGETPVG